MPQLILASQSPRRRELMTIAGYTFTMMTADIDETPFPHEPADLYTLRVSRDKAEAIHARLNREAALIITCDTTVAYAGQILGKPADADEARGMLRQLRGQHHQVYSSTTVLDTQTGEWKQELASTDLQMRPYTDAEIEAYIATGDPFDKAGSYAIQHAGFHPVGQLTGCYANVMGLPLCHLTRTLKQWGIYPTQDVPTACQSANAIVCEVYESILAG